MASELTFKDISGEVYRLNEKHDKHLNFDVYKWLDKKHLKIKLRNCEVKDFPEQMRQNKLQNGKIQKQHCIIQIK